MQVTFVSDQVTRRSLQPMFCLFGLKLYHNFSVMSGWSHRFLGITSTFWEVTTNVKQRVRTTGLEHQGQTSISDLDQNSGFSFIFTLGMQETVFLLYFGRA